MVANKPSSLGLSFELLTRLSSQSWYLLLLSDEINCRAINYECGLSPQWALGEANAIANYYKNSSIYPPPLLIHSLTRLCASIQLYVTCTATCASFTLTRIFQHSLVAVAPFPFIMLVSVLRPFGPWCSWSSSFALLVPQLMKFLVIKYYSGHSTHT